MSLRFVTEEIHSYLDYPVAIALVVTPFVLNLGESHPLALWLSVVTGLAAFALTILTNHKTGLIRVLPYKFHLLVDFIVGLSFVAAPFVLGFSGLDMAFYLANGITVLIVVGLHKPENSVALA